MKLFTKTEIFAVAAAVALFLVWSQWDKSVKHALPVEELFNVVKVAVPEFEQGDDPVIIFDYEAKMSSTVTRNVDIALADFPDSIPVCTGRTVERFEADSAEPRVGQRLSQFVGRVCPLAPGKYVPKVMTIVRVDGYPLKRQRSIGNQFNVLPRGAQPYLTAKDQEQLAKAQELLENPIPVK